MSSSLSLGSIATAQPSNPSLLAQAFFPTVRVEATPSQSNNPYLINSQSGVPMSNSNNLTTVSQPFSYTPNPQSPFVNSQTGTSINTTMTTTTTAYSNPFTSPVRPLPTTPQQLLHTQSEPNLHVTAPVMPSPTNPFASLSGNNATPSRQPSGYPTEANTGLANPFLTNAQPGFTSEYVIRFFDFFLIFF
jgi:hypothetical protein